MATYVVWLTGLSGSGKSTIATELSKIMSAMGQRAVILDGDTLRGGLNEDLGFSSEDRAENIRRVGAVAAILFKNEITVIVACISPYAAGRQLARSRITDGRFIEVFVDAPLEVCEFRDPKGLYRKSRAGEIPNFTGLTAPYEVPENPELWLDTSHSSPAGCAARIHRAMKERAF